MGFLAPAALLLAAAIAVPVILHLLQRQQGPRVVFPALRYLRRAERESARQIRLRQLLLLLVRAGLLLLLALAAARLFIRVGGAAHEPTAVAIVLDNSLSTGAVAGDRRVLDGLRERALAALERAGPDDRFWVLRAGAPWEPVVPGDALEAAARVRETEVSAAGAELPAMLARARALLGAGAEGRAVEIHLLTDLQATAFAGAQRQEGTPPRLIVWAPPGEPPANVGIADVSVGGGLPPRAGERSHVAAAIVGSGGAAPDSVDVRLALDGRPVAAAATAPGQTAILPLPARPAGYLAGWVETDADALRGDDRRYFVLRVEPAPTLTAPPGIPFLDEALAVLGDAGRIRRVAAGGAIIVAPGGAGAAAVRDGRAALVVPAAAQLELPALNRRLADAAIPWRMVAAPARGEARFQPGSDALLRGLEAVRVREAHRLERVGPAGEDTVLLRLADGAPWAVAGVLPGGGRYVLLASPLTLEATTLPTTPAMIPLLDRILSDWLAARDQPAAAEPGGEVAVPATAERVERPDGARDPVLGGTSYRAPALPGVYRFLAGDEVVGAFAVNPPPRESALERLDARALRAALPGWDPVLTRSPEEWHARIFHRRLGQEVWRPLLLLAILALLIEGWLAAAGRARPATSDRERAGAVRIRAPAASPSAGHET
jgi:hypothetical protein